MFHTPQKRIPKLHLSINNIDIEKVDSFNFLGLVLATHLKWNFHFSKVANKLTHINWILSKLEHIFSPRTLKTIYSSLIESHIIYRLVLWGTNYDRIFKLKKNCSYYFTCTLQITHQSYILFKSLGILNIKDMYNIGLLKLYFKIKMEQFHYIFIFFWLQKTYLLNHKDIISDINEELLFPFLQENNKNATLNTNLDSWYMYYQQKTAFYKELSITAYIHLYITLDNIS